MKFHAQVLKNMFSQDNPISNENRKEKWGRCSLVKHASKIIIEKKHYQLQTFSMKLKITQFSKYKLLC